ncbi:hypothetical protein Ddye_013607 [Dipteronia dyeriana]|uniref:Uncharacterized protein n=1 Tax=Dipteronia dyeriana TaxID=168575 RepID=A0AAD9X6Q2_9ROSI|nr:hypothetical protein Ddye_013607 [Dipteronia dyeriana]
MKSSFLALSILFLALSTKSSLGEQAEPLLDIRGDKVVVGTEYYIVSFIWGAGGGGLNLRAGRNASCPMDVFQEGRDTRYGIPLTFLHVSNQDDNVIYESTDVNIKFTSSPLPCNQPTVWKVDKYDESTGLRYITTNGVAGNAGTETLQSLFKFEKYEQTYAYKIVHCHSVCESCVKLCSNVGRDGVRRLALEETPFVLLFIKVSDTDLLIKQKNEV